MQASGLPTAPACHKTLQTAGCSAVTRIRLPQPPRFRFQTACAWFVFTFVCVSTKAVAAAARRWCCGASRGFWLYLDNVQALCLIVLAVVGACVGVLHCFHLQAHGDPSASECQHRHDGTLPAAADLGPHASHILQQHIKSSMLAVLPQNQLHTSPLGNVHAGPTGSYSVGCPPILLQRPGSFICRHNQRQCPDPAVPCNWSVIEHASLVQRSRACSCAFSRRFWPSSSNMDQQARAIIPSPGSSGCAAVHRVVSPGIQVPSASSAGWWCPASLPTHRWRTQSAACHPPPRCSAPHSGSGN